MYYMKVIVFVFLFLFSIASSKAQNKDLTPRFEEFLKGDISVIGNNIVNRNVPFTPVNKEYDDRDKGAKNSEDFSMEYINVDEKQGVFSSSCASLIVNAEGNPRIKHVGLYWSATYPYKKGKKKGNDFYAKDPGREPFDRVKIKFPQAKQYVDVTGEVIYDGRGKQKNAPYVAYADITNMILKLDQWQGEYTLANICSATGEIEGGVSAGWVIVFVYEKENMPMQKISIYDGFQIVDEKPREISFSNFKTTENGQIKVKMAVAALGGTISKEGTLMSAVTKAGGVIPVEVENKRTSYNFFNSSITEYDNYSINRKPAGLNTLGFDIATDNLKNLNNAVVDNSQEEISFRTINMGKPVNIFMFALAVPSEKVEKNTNTKQIREKVEEAKAQERENVEKIKKETKDVIENISGQPQIKTNNKVSVDTKVPVENIKIPVPVRQIQTKTQESEKNEQQAKQPQSIIVGKEQIQRQNEVSVTEKEINQALDKIKKEQEEELQITQVKTGFYTILGAYTSEMNAKEFVKSLKEIGIKDASYFLDPETKKYYIYNHFSKDRAEATRKKKELLEMKLTGEKFKDLKEIWIMKINQKKK